MGSRKRSTSNRWKQARKGLLQKERWDSCRESIICRMLWYHLIRRSSYRVANEGPGVTRDAEVGL